MKAQRHRPSEPLEPVKAPAGMELTLDDLYEMAEQIERGGAGFYKRAADMARDQVGLELFVDLARMEDDHEQVFSAMRQNLPDSPRARRPPGRYDRHWPAILRSMLDRFDEDLEELFRGKRAREELLRAAMDFERDTIIFHLGMKQMIPSAADRKQIDRIIQEELGHLVQLGSKLATARQGR